MNTKVKKSIFWGGIIASMVLIMNLFGGLNALADGPRGHGEGGMVHSGQGGNHMMGHHHSEFSWFWFLLLLIIGIAVLVLLLKWLRRKSKSSAMQQFIDTSLISSQKPLTNQSANVLDQWEKNIDKKKENE